MAIRRKTGGVAAPALLAMAVAATPAIAAPTAPAPDGYIQLHLNGIAPPDTPVYTITYTVLAAISGLPPVMRDSPSFLHLDGASLISGVGPRLLFMGAAGSGGAVGSSPAASNPFQGAIASLPSGSAATPPPEMAAAAARTIPPGPSLAPGPTNTPVTTLTNSTPANTTPANTTTETATNLGDPQPIVPPVLADETPTAIPEPATLSLAAGALAMAVVARRRRWASRA